MSSAAISRGYAASSTQFVGRGFTASFAPDVKPIIFNLDEDAAVRESPEPLIRREGWRSNADARIGESDRTELCGLSEIVSDVLDKLSVLLEFGGSSGIPSAPGLGLGVIVDF
jgi:hypothetical protein